MLKKVLAGAAVAAASTVAVAAPASACVTASNDDGLRESIQQAQASEMSGETSGTWGNHYGDVAVGEQHGLINTNGAPFLNLDLRCAVPNADGSVGHAFLGNKNSCSEAPVDQFHKGGILS